MKEGKREGYRERERSGRRGRVREDRGGERQNTRKTVILWGIELRY